MNSPTILFLYGSLKRGRENHRLIADQEFVGNAVTEAVYRILDLGRYPGLIRDEVRGLAVTGELWAVDPCKLAELDEFEEGEGLWKRGSVAIAGRDGAEAYFWVGAVPEGASSGPNWPIPES